MMTIFLGAVIFLVTNPVSSDLPVHCLLSDIVGDWILRFSDSKVTSPTVCRTENSPESTHVIPITLTSNRIEYEAPAKPELKLDLKAYSRGRPASWTVIYDDGLIIKLAGDKERILYGHFDFEATGDPRTSLQSGFVKEDGSTPGFASLCWLVTHGWVLNRNDNSLSCFSAVKITEKETSEQGNIRATREKKGETKHIATETGGHHEVNFPDELKTNHIAIQTGGHHIVNFPEKFQSMWTSNIPAAVPQMLQQGANCGSCFVYALAFALERIASMKLLENQANANEQELPFNLDREAMLACAFSSQGCDGGYYSALSLDLSYTGARLFDPNDPQICFLGDNAGPSSKTGKARECDFTSCFQEQSQLIYTKGFRDLRSESDIMESLQRNGPVLVGVKMSHQNQPETQAGILVVDPLKGQGGWDFINHGLVITGWGQDLETGTLFWNAYNPWGSMVRIARGANHAGLAKYATELIVDETRGVFAKAR